MSYHAPPCTCGDEAELHFFMATREFKRKVKIFQLVRTPANDGWIIAYHDMEGARRDIPRKATFRDHWTGLGLYRIKVLTT